MGKLSGNHPSRLLFKTWRNPGNPNLKLKSVTSRTSFIASYQHFHVFCWKAQMLFRQGTTLFWAQPPNVKQSKIADPRKLASLGIGRRSGDVPPDREGLLDKPEPRRDGVDRHHEQNQHHSMV